MRKLNGLLAFIIAFVFVLPVNLNAAEKTKIVTQARLVCTDGIASENRTGNEGSTVDMIEVDGNGEKQDVALELQMTTALKAQGFVLEFETVGLELNNGDIAEVKLSKQNGTGEDAKFESVGVTMSEVIITDTDGNTEGFRIKLSEKDVLEAGSYKLSFKLINEFVPKEDGTKPEEDESKVAVFSLDLKSIGCKAVGGEEELIEESWAAFANHYNGSGDTVSAENYISMMFMIVNGNPVHDMHIDVTSDPLPIGGHTMKFYFEALDKEIDVNNFQLSINLIQYGGAGEGAVPYGADSEKQRGPVKGDISWTVEKLSKPIDKDGYSASHVLKVTLKDDPRLSLYKDEVFLLGFGFSYEGNSTKFIDLGKSYSHIDRAEVGDGDEFSYDVFGGYKDFPRVEVENGDGENISGDDIDGGGSVVLPSSGETETFTPDEGGGISIISKIDGGETGGALDVLRRNPVPIRLDIDKIAAGLLDMNNLHSLEIEVIQKGSSESEPNLQVWFVPEPVAANANEMLKLESAENSNVIKLTNGKADMVQHDPDGDGTAEDFDISLLPDFQSELGEDGIADTLDILLYPDWDETANGTFELEVSITPTIFQDESYNKNGIKIVKYSYYELLPFTDAITLNDKELNAVN